MENNYSNADFFEDLLKEMEQISVHVSAAKQLIETRKVEKEEVFKEEPTTTIETPTNVVETPAPAPVETLETPTTNRMDNIFEDLGFTVPTQNNVSNVPNVPAEPAEPVAVEATVAHNVPETIEVPTPVQNTPPAAPNPIPEPAPVVPEVKNVEVPNMPSFGGTQSVDNQVETPAVSPLYGNVQPIETPTEPIVSPYQGNSLFGAGQPTEVREDAPIAPIQGNPLFGTDVPVANPNVSFSR